LSRKQIERVIELQDRFGVNIDMTPSSPDHGSEAYFQRIERDLAANDPIQRELATRLLALGGDQVYLIHSEMFDCRYLLANGRAFDPRGLRMADLPTTDLHELWFSSEGGIRPAWGYALQAGEWSFHHWAHDGSAVVEMISPHDHYFGVLDDERLLVMDIILYHEGLKTRLLKAHQKGTLFPGAARVLQHAEVLQRLAEGRADVSDLKAWVRSAFTPKASS